ncbi:MAG TPA: hypothetical protein VLA34_11930, partial [Candidatus Krumholzibacterium sp.]|nr:hypothetical protein [Candidatus Krumholzibacterium sp.]
TMFDTDMVFYVDGVERSLKDFHEADDVAVHVKVRNIGGSPAGTEDIRLRVLHRTYDDSEVLFDGEVDVPEVLRTSDTVIPLPAGSMKPGGHILEAEIEVTSAEDATSNNASKTVYSVEGSAGGLIGHNMRPNPVTGSFSEALFCVDLEVPADLRIEIMTLEGDLVARGELGYRFGKPLDAGYTCTRCGDLFDGEKDLVSGIYIYRIRYFGQDGTKSDHHGRFAIVR